MSRSHRALVIGGSIAGLFAARVLAEHFGRITILERDTLPDAPVPRRGAPQAQHNHVLLLRGRQVMENLFPGLGEAVLADGGLLMDMANDLAWLTPWGWGVRFESPLRMLACSRALLEWRVRRMLTSTMNFELVQGACAGFLIDRDRVRGVKSEAGVDLEADLVVDASGRGSHAPRWLVDGGFERPRETTVNAFLGYASRFYRPTPDPGRWWKGMYIQSAPPESPRVGVILPIEGGLWHVTLGGGDRQYPATDERGFEEFARSLRSPALADALRGAEPLSPIHATRSTDNRQRHFEAIRMPEGFVVTGDAACAFNPVYGQGMTTAALGAVTLAQSLRDTAAATGLPHGDGLPRRFQRALARVNAVPWTLAVGEDLRYRSTEGAPAGLGTRVTHRYMDAVGRLTAHNTRVRLALLRAFHLVAPPSSLFAPRIIWSVIRNGIDGSDASSTSVQTRARAPIV